MFLALERHVWVDFLHFVFLAILFSHLACGLESRTEHTQLDDSSDGDKGPESEANEEASGIVTSMERRGVLPFQTCPHMRLHCEDHLGAQHAIWLWVFSHDYRL